MIGLGAFLLSAFPESTPAGVIQEGGDAIFDGFGTIALALAFLMLLPVIAANMYGGSLTLITIADSVKRVQASRRSDSSPSQSSVWRRPQSRSLHRRTS